GRGDDLCIHRGVDQAGGRDQDRDVRVIDVGRAVRGGVLLGVGLGEVHLLGDDHEVGRDRGVDGPGQLVAQVWVADAALQRLQLSVAAVDAGDAGLGDAVARGLFDGAPVARLAGGDGAVHGLFAQPDVVVDPGTADGRVALAAREPGAAGGGTEAG